MVDIWLKLNHSSKRRRVKPLKKTVLMNPEQLQQMILWLRQQIVIMCESMNEARRANNYIKEAQYEGMRDAFMRCLNKLIYITEESVDVNAIIPVEKKKFKLRTHES